MKKPKVIQMQAPLAKTEVILEEAVLAIRAAWQVYDIVKERPVGWRFVYLDELFSPETGEIVVPVPNNKTSHWLRFLTLAIASGLIVEDGLRLDISSAFMDWLVKYHEEWNRGMDKDRVFEVASKVIGKKCVVVKELTKHD